VLCFPSSSNDDDEDDDDDDDEAPIARTPPTWRPCCSAENDSLFDGDDDDVVVADDDVVVVVDDDDDADDDNPGANPPIYRYLAQSAPLFPDAISILLVFFPFFLCNWGLACPNGVLGYPCIHAFMHPFIHACMCALC
jgi:hypothetical protein